MNDNAPANIIVRLLFIRSRPKFRAIPLLVSVSLEFIIILWNICIVFILLNAAPNQKNVAFYLLEDNKKNFGTTW